MKNKDNFLSILNIIEKIFLVITVISLISLIAFFCIVDFTKADSDFGKLELYNENWSVVNPTGENNPYASGEYSTNSDSITISSRISPADSGKVIMFYNKRQGVEVSVGEKVLYSANSSSLAKKVSSTSYVVVRIPESEIYYTVKIRFSNFENKTAVLPDIYCGTLYQVSYLVPFH